MLPAAQIKHAPVGAIYVCGAGEEKAARMHVEQMERLDLYVVPPSYLEAVPRYFGHRTITGVLVENEQSLLPAQAAGLAQLRAAIRS